jgi:hypothetical protein
VFQYLQAEHYIKAFPLKRQHSNITQNMPVMNTLPFTLLYVWLENVCADTKEVPMLIDRTHKPSLSTTNIQDTLSSPV